jgi:hypothetical protein
MQLLLNTVIGLQDLNKLFCVFLIVFFERVFIVLTVSTINKVGTIFLLYIKYVKLWKLQCFVIRRHVGWLLITDDVHI